jgi:hypothetical protein
MWGRFFKSKFDDSVIPFLEDLLASAGVKGGTAYTDVEDDLTAELLSPDDEPMTDKEEAHHRTMRNTTIVVADLFLAAIFQLMK